jgi:2-polyprenyl-3-methyl-5-hydroxy-6-metoxy-1,4-benzoquinol methylase
MTPGRPAMDKFLDHELESVSSCTACNGSLVPFLSGVRDTTFSNVDGDWNLARCARCGSLGLTPRPSEHFIGKAYETYYTHVASSDGPKLSSFRERLVDRWTDHGVSARSLTDRALAPVLRLMLLAGDFRGLDSAKRPLSIIDIGCGNGAFLARAKRRGHNVLGVDNDAQAVAAARALGVPCEVLKPEQLVPRYGSQFDLVTASHVIEHVHAPRVFLDHCFALLRPGGTLWLETPNADAWGRRMYGRYWRGLEAPRHLCIFTPRAIREATKAAGFAPPRFHWTGLVSPYTFSHSAQAKRSAAQDSGKLRVNLALVAAAALLDLTRAAVGRAAQEFITMTATKPNPGNAEP